MKRGMHLMGYCIAGPTWHNNGAWKHPESDALDALKPERYENIARILEEGLFDGLFFVDVLMILETFRGGYRANTQEPGQMFLMDPMPLLSAMARVTKNIGLSCTMSTSFYHPFHIARQYATLDHMSNGRAGWNVVTSISDVEAKNYGMEKMLDKSQRYDMADEVIEACQALWNSWEPDALIADPINGVFADPDKIHRADYEGKYVKTRGPLPVPHSPQTSPVLMQAGSSERGREFAGRWAEVIFTLQHDKKSMQEFYKDIKARVRKYGREEHHCAVVPGIDVIIGETESIAKERQENINSLVSVDLAVAEISNGLGIDLSDWPLDKPLEDMDLPQASRGIFEVILQGSKAKNLTLRDAARAFGENQLTPQVVGTASQVADHMQDLFESEACDGFIISPSLSPSSYVSFVKSVVPELQRRGLYRTEYTGKTFRENLRSGL